jgi:hypothetical protein
MSKKRTAVHNKREPIHLSRKVGMAHIENNDRIFCLVMERSTGAGRDNKMS